MPLVRGLGRLDLGQLSAEAESAGIELRLDVRDDEVDGRVVLVAGNDLDVSFHGVYL
jgi:hypothetical protein